MNEKQLTASLGGGRGLPRLGDELDVDVLRQGGEGDLQTADRVLVRVLLLGRVAEMHGGVGSLQIFLFVVKNIFRLQNCPCLLALKVGGESLGLAGVELDDHGGSGHPRVRAEKAEME